MHIIQSFPSVFYKLHGFIMAIKGFPLRASEHDFFNCRKKYIVDEFGEARLIEVLTSSKGIFNPLKIEIIDRDKKTLRTFASDDLSSDDDTLALDRVSSDSLKRSQARAKRKVRDYILGDSDLCYFITLTLSGKFFPRDDVKISIKKLINFLNNRVQRNGLKYVIVPEFHKDGKSLHFHGFINNALAVVDSGTFIPPSGGKPLKAETLRKKKIDTELCTKVYNIPDWKYGFTTAIKIYGDRMAAANYVAKYISKDIEGHSRSSLGRYYYSSNNLKMPIYDYCNIDYDKAPGIEITESFYPMKIFFPSIKIDT